MTAPSAGGPDHRPGNPVQRLPLPALFAVLVALWVGGRVVFEPDRIDGLTVGIDIATGVVFAAALTAIIAARRRRLGGTDASLTYVRAVRTGTVPDGVDTARWHEELPRTAATVRRQRWFIRIGGLLPFGLGIWGLTAPDARAVGALLVVLMVAGWIVAEVSSRRTLARIARLRASLRA